jgi:radical SAM protein with 4Fe4S-binding SPASM domain
MAPDGELRTANSVLNREEFEAGATELKSYPQVLFVELTENCNLSCPMCRSAGPYRRERNMSQELFIRIAEELFPHALMVDLRGWGESTILKSFRSYVDQTIAYGCRLRIVTNLTVTNDDLWRHLVRANCTIAISFDAADPATFATLRRGAKLDRIVRNLSVLVDECARLGRSTDGIYLNVVVQSAALAQIHEIVRIAGRAGLRRVHLNPVSLPVAHPGHLSRWTGQLPPMLARVQETADELGVEVVIGAALDDSLALPAYTRKRCTHPWMYCYVNYRGEVGFCDHLIGNPKRQYLLGDLATQSFQDIWNGAAYQQLRREHGQWQFGLDPRFEECNWCYRNRYVDFDDQIYSPYGCLVVSTRNTPELFASRAGAEQAHGGALGRRALPLVSQSGHNGASCSCPGRADAGSD